MPEIREHVLRRRTDRLDAELEPGEYLPLRRGTGWGDLAHIAVCCPRCRSLSLLTRRDGWAIDFDGLVTPPAKCGHCGFSAVWRLAEWVPEAVGSA